MKPLDIIQQFKSVLAFIEPLPLNKKIWVLNKIKILLHEISPFKSEPVDCVLWIPESKIQANDYNPNKVAPPEMKLLERSIDHDGYTQPVVTWDLGERREVIDGFHRTRVCKESEEINKRVHGYLPVVSIQDSCSDRKDRIASTIRHNRARGKHQINSMSDIVVELKNRNWANSRICRELGMDEDEVLRLCQITGLSDLFKDDEFSKSWDVSDSEIDDFEALTDEITEQEKEEHGFRTINTNDPDRIFHTYHKWECWKAGFYKTSKDGMKKEECEQAYYDFLMDEDRFRKALNHVITEWKYSCEHYLTNISMNRIAWLGQASMCYATGIPATFRSGFYKLSEKQQNTANLIALEYLNKWLINNDREQISIETVFPDRQSTIY